MLVGPMTAEGGGDDRVKECSGLVIGRIGRLFATGRQRLNFADVAPRGVICDVVASGGAVVRGSWPSRKLSSGQFQAGTGGASAGVAEAPSPWGEPFCKQTGGPISGSNGQSPVARAAWPFLAS